MLTLPFIQYKDNPFVEFTVNREQASYKDQGDYVHTCCLLPQSHTGYEKQMCFLYNIARSQQKAYHWAWADEKTIPPSGRRIAEFQAQKKAQREKQLPNGSAISELDTEYLCTQKYK